MEKTAKGYGRFLCFLHQHGWLDPELPPLKRVTRHCLRVYFRNLKAAGNADYTIIGRFSELTTALRIMAPGCNVSWVRKPDGVTIYALLAKQRRPMLAPDSGVAFRWAIEMMGEARARYEQRSHRIDLIEYRDGLLLAIFASRGRRLRSMALPRIGHELVQCNGHFRVELASHQVKTPKPDSFNLPEELSPYVFHYLQYVRPRLLRGQSHDALWVSLKGSPLTEKAIENQVFKRTRKRFGQGFGPHRFRHAIATTAVLRDPAHPGLAAGLLGISGRVVEEHYRLAGQSKAAMAFDQVCERRQRVTMDGRQRHQRNG